MSSTPVPSARRVALVAVMAITAAAARAGEELPSPAAMALGQRLVPVALVRGFEDALADEILDRVVAGRVPATRLPALRARARAAMAPALAEAFPDELVAGACGLFVARHYTPDELRALTAWEGSPLGQKLRTLDAQAAAVPAGDPAAAERAREDLARRTFGEAERKEIAAFAATPLARKGRDLAPELTAHVLEQLDRRLKAEEATLRPRLQSAAQAVLETEPKPKE